MNPGKFLSKYIEQIYALMRIIVGFLFLCHGIQKIYFISSGTMPANDVLLLLAMIIETIGGLMIMFGYQTRWAAFIASGEMAVAYFKFHAARGILPINNGGELPVFFCFVFLFIASYGPGIWSVDYNYYKGK